MRMINGPFISLGGMAVVVLLQPLIAVLYPSQQYMLWATSAAGILLAGYGFMALKRRIARPLSSVADTMALIAQGDLRGGVETAGKDGIGSIAGHVNAMVSVFSGMIDKVLTSSNSVIATVDSLRTRAEQTSAGARSQSGQAEQIVTAAAEMSQTITDIARNASSAAEDSSSAMQVAAEGKRVADGAVATVNRVHDSTVELSRMVESLNNRVEEIGDIVTVIKEIADQTNLLALNAAIEAARAGDQGRGFAVVADEVRKLAERTIKATDEISGKIGAVQTGAAETMKSMGEASGEVKNATDYIRNVGSSLAVIVSSVQKVKDQITQIAASVEEQSATADEVTKNIEKTSAIARDMERMSGEVLHEVNTLTEIKEVLRGSTEGFKTRASELMILDLAKGDHRTWVNRIAAFLRGEVQLDAAQLADHTTCRLGKWYYGEGMKKCGTMASFKTIEAYHAKIHAIGKEIVTLKNRGDGKRSEALFTDMESVSHEVIRHLDELKRECTAQHTN